jgi:hypothetical protein
MPGRGPLGIALKAHARLQFVVRTLAPGGVPRSSPTGFRKARRIAGLRGGGKCDANGYRLRPAGQSLTLKSRPMDSQCCPPLHKV